jgi:hypothetical protein
MPILTLGRELREPLEMYAMYEISLLRYGYFRTSDPNYLNRAEQMLASYSRLYGGGARGPMADLSLCQDYTHPWADWTLPRRLRAYIRFLTFLQKSEMDPDLVTDVMKELLQDEELQVTRGPIWRVRPYSPNYPQYMGTESALVAGIFFEFKEAHEWWDDEYRRMLDYTADIYPDGSTIEFSPSYTEAWVHWMDPISNALRAFESPMRIEIPRYVQARYEKLFDWELAMRKPDGRDVQLNDTGSSRPPEWYGRMAGTLFSYFGREDLRWFASRGKEGHAPFHASFPPTSTTPSYAGYCAMRSDWSRDARYLVTSFGPIGDHAHPHYGSFVLHAYGADLIDEGGCAAFGSEACERYSRQPWAHNIVGIDGLAQINTAGGRPPLGQALYNWVTNSVYDYAWGSYPFEVLSSKLKGINWDRAVYFVKPDYFLLLDRISGDGRHKIRSKMQLSWDVSAEVQGASVTARSQRGAWLKIMPIDRRTAPTIVRGQKEPFWDGWISKIPHSNLVEPAPAVIYEESRGLPLSYETLLYPGRGTDVRVEVNETASDGGGESRKAGVLLTVRPSDQLYQDKIVVSEGGGPVEFVNQGIAVDGRLAHLRYEGNVLRRVAFVKTSSVSVLLGGKPATIRFEVPSEGYLDVDADGRPQKVYLDLSNREETENIQIEIGGTKPLRAQIPVGKETSLPR